MHSQNSWTYLDWLSLWMVTTISDAPESLGLEVYRIGYPMIGEKEWWSNWVYYFSEFIVCRLVHNILDQWHSLSECFVYEVIVFIGWKIYKSLYQIVSYDVISKIEVCSWNWLCVHYILLFSLSFIPLSSIQSIFENLHN